MDVSGLNLKVQSSKLEDFESPDTTNAFFYGGKYNILGARQGKTSHNTSAYDARVLAVIPTRFGNARKWILAETDGSFRPVTAPLATLNYPTYTPLAHLMDFGGQVSVTMGWPTETVEWYSTFTTPIRAPMDNELFIVDFPKIVFTTVSSGAAAGPSATLKFGIYKNGVAYYPSGEHITLIGDAAPGGTGVCTIDPTGTIYISSPAGYDNTLTGLIDGLAIQIYCPWATLPGVTGGSIAISEIFYAGVI